MAYKITGDLSDSARLLVLDEATMTIESNTTVSGGAFEAAANNNDNKIIIARNSNGESFGYGNITPVMTGPILVEDFTTGIGDWTISEDLGNANVTWFNNNSMKLYANSSGGRGADAVWNTQVTDDFDVEFDFDTTNHSTAAGDVTILTLMVGSDFDHVRYTVREASIGAKVFLQANSIVEEEIDLSTDVWTGKFRVVRSNNTYIAYIDSGSGWEEKLNTEYLGWTGPFGVKAAVYVNSASITTLINSVTVNAGTIV